MAVERTDTTLKFNRNDSVHISTWKDGLLSPKRIFFLIHGLMMHGRSFEHLASFLAAEGSLVVAPDIRGFGRSYFVDDEKKVNIDYRKSLDEMSYIVSTLEDSHPGLPLFCVGESLGAHLARRLAAAHPELISGLILSSPCLRPQMMTVPLLPYTCSELLLSGLNPQREINLSPFARHFLKEEKDNLDLYLSDPMTRKSLEVLELIDTLRIAGVNDSAEVPDEVPILVFKGKNDCVCKISSTKKFLDTLNRSNMTIHDFNDCGHIILQGKIIDERILSVLKGWMHKRELHLSEQLS